MSICHVENQWEKRRTAFVLVFFLRYLSIRAVSNGEKCLASMHFPVVIEFLSLPHHN
jgi:hypothetical protein